MIEAPTGAGKTTRVPPALMPFGPIVVLEPRRLAARMAARRVAQELGEPVGRTVGYRVRFAESGGPETGVWYWTEGVLTRRMLADPALHEAGVVVLDEFHERHIDTDLAIALLRRLQHGARPDLRIVVMSAAGANHNRSGRLLGAALPTGKARISEEISQAPVAGEAALSRARLVLYPSAVLTGSK